MSNYVHRDLSLGEPAQDKALAQIRKKYPEAEPTTGVNKDGDIFIPEIDIFVECKNDLMSERTGNVAIEFECYGKPSGIAATKSDWFYYCFIYEGKELCVWIETSVLLSACKDCPIVEGGDDGAAIMYLMPVKKMIEIAFLAHSAERIHGKNKAHSSNL